MESLKCFPAWPHFTCHSLILGEFSASGVSPWLRILGACNWTSLDSSPVPFLFAHLALYPLIRMNQSQECESMPGLWVSQWLNGSGGDLGTPDTHPLTALEFWASGH